MLAMVTDGGALPDIGSVAKSASSTDDTSFTDFICSTPEARSIRATFGEGAYYDYVAHLANAREAETVKAAKAAERAEQKADPGNNPGTNQTSLRSKIRRWFSMVKQSFKK